MSLPEVLLWQVLRQRPDGLKFRHQHPSGPYSADFYCHEAKLIIEIDGEAHGMGKRPKRDAVRDEWFAARGFDVMRIPARDVLADVNAVAEGIAARAAAARRSGEE
jgi:very-short-patch-repair endonuclease